jgi:hypothetical protein
MVWVAFNNVPFIIVYVAIGVAVLKYRLYDIDIIINRTLVYGSLTGILALVYFGGVTATQAVLQAFTDQERLPQLVIVASTLAIAALFNPLRRRVQSFVDRRFYRRKYDAARTLAAFNARLRDETELETLSGDVVSVVKGDDAARRTSVCGCSPIGRQKEVGEGRPSARSIPAPTPTEEEDSPMAYGGGRRKAYSGASRPLLHSVWGRVVADIPDFCRELVAALSEGQEEASHQPPHQWSDRRRPASEHSHLVGHPIKSLQMGKRYPRRQD